jgi:hypothetical protein
MLFFIIQLLIVTPAQPSVAEMVAQDPLWRASDGGSLNGPVSDPTDSDRRSGSKDGARLLVTPGSIRGPAAFDAEARSGTPALRPG